MAKSTTGKWVSRVAASGGSKAYKKSRPTNYYGVLALIVVIGLLATAYSRYEYQNPNNGTTGETPHIGQSWYAALAVENCGTTIPFLNTNTTATAGYHVLPADVVKISPISVKDAGANDTLAQFALEYTGMIATSSNLAIPTSTGTLNAATTFKTGETCATGTKYAGEKGVVEYAYWSSFGQKKPTITTDPTSIHLTNYMRVTMAFVPSSVVPSAPQSATVTAMVQAATSSTTTTAVTTPVTSTTTVTATTAHVTTTTAHVTTTTAAVTTTSVKATTTTQAG